MISVQDSPLTRLHPRVLVVDDEPVLLELFRDVLSARIDCDLHLAGSLDEARRAIEQQPIDLLITDIHLPDGNGLDLLAEIRRRRPGAASIVVSGTVNASRALAALRGGAIDFLRKPFTPEQLASAIELAIDNLRRHNRRKQRIIRLRKTVRELNSARKTIGKKVDLLCNDLVSAYSELSQQMTLVRVQESFQQLVDRADGLEQVLCNSMDWLLRQIGHSNIGIWLTTAEQELQLGAYMKYTVQADPKLTAALERNLLRMAGRKGFVRLRGQDLQSSLTPPELQHLSGHDVLAAGCTYLGETLGVVMLFRDERAPFREEDSAALRCVLPLLSAALARAVKGDASEHQPPSPTEPHAPPAKKPAEDPSDWWKRGEAPPF